MKKLVPLELRMNEFYDTKQKLVRVKVIEKGVELSVTGEVPGQVLYGAILERSPKNAQAYYQITFLPYNGKPQRQVINYLRFPKKGERAWKWNLYDHLRMEGCPQKIAEDSVKMWEKIQKKYEVYFRANPIFGK